MPFVRSWFTPEQVIGRMQNIMMPACEMAGMECQVAQTGIRHIGSPHYYHLRPDFKRLKAIRKPEKFRHTVTIREVWYKRHRNSDRSVWLEFANRIGARVLDEHEFAKTDFHERFAIYAGADMNWGVVNGPLAALYLTDYPVRMYCTSSQNKKGMSGHHILPGEQMPFGLPHQQLVWKEPTLETLMQDYNELQLDAGRARVGRLPRGYLCRFCSTLGEGSIGVRERERQIRSSHG
jgi:hypothetical protein